MSEAGKEGIRQSRFGKKHSIKTRIKMSEAQEGSKSYLWKGGITPINRHYRNCVEFRLWREAIFTRDNYACCDCGMRSGNGQSVYLHPHHIKSFADYPELRFVVDNGTTLCEDCHSKKHHRRICGKR